VEAGDQKKKKNYYKKKKRKKREKDIKQEEKANCRKIKRCRDGTSTVEKDRDANRTESSQMTGGI
jgi:hypothetical protein